MDTNHALERMRELADAIANDDDHTGSAHELAYHALALDQQLRKGGALPAAWSAPAWQNEVTIAQSLTLGSKLKQGDVTRVSFGGAGLSSVLPLRHLHERPVRARDRPRGQGELVSATRYTKEEREAKRSERLALLDRAVEELTSSEAWAAWLGVRRRFHAYSWRNQLMISIQRPDTLAVKGLRQWTELGRRVRKGSAAIWILAPAPYKTEERDAEGNQLKKMYFKPVAVFAYEDTDQIEDGPVFQIEPPFADVEGDSHEPQLRQLVTWLARARA
jgi:hypothetical protein